MRSLPSIPETALADRTGWEARLLSCLNFVSGERFTSLQEASLMADIHEELKQAIASY